MSDINSNVAELLYAVDKLTELGFEVKPRDFGCARLLDQSRLLDPYCAKYENNTLNFIDTTVIKKLSTNTCLIGAYNINRYLESGGKLPENYTLLPGKSESYCNGIMEAYDFPENSLDSILKDRRHIDLESDKAKDFIEGFNIARQVMQILEEDKLKELNK